MGERSSATCVVPVVPASLRLQTGTSTPTLNVHNPLSDFRAISGISERKEDKLQNLLKEKRSSESNPGLGLSCVYECDDVFCGFNLKFPFIHILK